MTHNHKNPQNCQKKHRKDHRAGDIMTHFLTTATTLAPLKLPIAFGAVRVGVTGSQRGGVGW